MATHSAYAKLVERGCICGGNHDGPFTCPLHPGPSDNRGLAAFFRAGMPLAFPTSARCGRVLTWAPEGHALTRCGAVGLMYPDVELDRVDLAREMPKCRPTLVCPRCSSPAAERALVAEVEAARLHRLNDRRVFA